MVFTVMGRAPALDQDRGPLQIRSIYDYADYGFTVRGSLNERFEIIPIRTDDAEAFVFFYPKDDLQAGPASARDRLIERAPRKLPTLGVQ